MEGEKVELDSFAVLFFFSFAVLTQTWPEAKLKHAG